jgi:predicted Rossmann fold flavoprotein
MNKTKINNTLSPGKTVVIGGGAAGLMAAGIAAQKGAEVVLFEKMAQTGRKIGISGKGRCNLTNSAELADFLAQFGKDGRFLRQCFQQFFSAELLEFFKEQELDITLERGGRYFPSSGRALDVVRVFNTWLKNTGVIVHTSSPVSEIVVQNEKVQGVVAGGKNIDAQNIILATGGKSYQRTGSTGDGYTFAQKLGHNVTPLSPALVPVVSNNPHLKALAGLELRNISLRLFIEGKKKAQEFGELAFTATGLSGPTTLTLSEQVVSALKKQQKVALVIDLKPALDEKKLDARLLRDLEKRAGEPIDSLLRGILPVQLIPVCLAEMKISEKIDTKNFPAKLRKKIVRWLKEFRFEITGYRSWNEAIITAGGVSLKEVDPKTMESKLIEGLFITGELLNLQAATGGYNLQAAFSTGWLAGNSIR